MRLCFLHGHPNVLEPVLQHPGSGVLLDGRDAAASVMTAHNNVPDLQDLDGVLKHAHQVHVGIDDLIGNVPVDEDIARQQSCDLVRRHTAVGTSDPQVLGPLLLLQLCEEAGALDLDPPCPLLVVLQQPEDLFHALLNPPRQANRNPNSSLAEHAEAAELNPNLYDSFSNQNILLSFSLRTLRLCESKISLLCHSHPLLRPQSRDLGDIARDLEHVVLAVVVAEHGDQLVQVLLDEPRGELS